MGINYSYFTCNNSPNYTENNINNNTNNTNYTYVNCDSFIGNTFSESIPISSLVISIIGLILNLLLIKDFIIKRSFNSRKQSSMKKLFTVLPVLECITSIYWIISSTLFKKAEYICNKPIFCFILSITYYVVYIFEFIFINFILVNFRKISLNPLEGILKPGKNIKKYIIISLILTLLITGSAIWFKVLGRSVMNTCFINTEQSGKMGLIFLIPIFFTLLVIIQVIYDLKCRQMFEFDKQVREAYKDNSLYVLLFSLMHIPMFVLIILTSIKEDIFTDYDYILKNYTICTTLFTCSIPMIIGIIRNCKGFTKIKKIKKMERKITQNFKMKKSMLKLDSTFSKTLNESFLTPEDQFDWLEKHAMEYFMRDILLGVAHCINGGKQYGSKISFQEIINESESFVKHNICFENFKLNDPSVNESEYLDVNIIEYAPKIFAYLRNLENIDIDGMTNSFLPKNNKQGISESQGKSGSFFISTDDNQYMIKTLRVDEFDLIRKTFLNEYVQYLTKNKNSLLCRIYGMYNIIMNQGDEILIIVMRNVIGKFKNNIIAKYDLKGSSKNRVSQFDMANTDSSTMKDLNFNEFEHGIMLSRKNIICFRKLIKYDSTFLKQMSLMDYSLFLVKITLSKEQANDLFGDKIREKQDSAFSELMIENSIKPSATNMNIDGTSLKMNYENLNVDELKPSNTLKEKGIIYKNIKYYKQFLFPSLNPGSAYILAIIDYFQIFNFYKYVESGLKTKFFSKKDKISCVDPRTYSKRFIKYFEQLTDIKHMLKDGQKIEEIKSKGCSINNEEEEEEDEKEKEEENDSLSNEGLDIEKGE